MIACVDLFCGLGGLTHGLSRGGVRVIAGIDVDPECRFPYEANNDARFLELDVQKVTGDHLRALWKEVNGDFYTLLAGCAPCQPFSTYGRHKDRQPSSKAKWNLVTGFGRLVGETRPDFVTMENVPQLVNHEVFQDFILALRDYWVWWEVIDCLKYNVPQTRKRLVLVASRLGPIGLVLPTRSSKSPAKGPTVRASIAHLKPLRAGESDPDDPLHSACKLSQLNLSRIRSSIPGGTWRDWPPSLIAKCHEKISGGTYPGVYGRMEWDAPGPTITTQSFGYGNGRFGHPEQDRAITLREAAILQSFPSTYRFLPKNEKVRFSVLGRLIGNAVPVQIGAMVAQSLIDHLSSPKRLIK